MSSLKMLSGSAILSCKTNLGLNDRRLLNHGKDLFLYPYFMAHAMVVKLRFS